MLDRGEVLITTLGRCQTIEHPQRSDPGEGRRNVTNGRAVSETNVGELIAMLNRSGCNISPGAISVQGRNAISIAPRSVMASIASPNCLMYCLSDDLSLRMSQDFEGESDCIEIVQPNEFFLALQYALTPHLEALGVRVNETSRGFKRCGYRSRVQTWDEKPFDPYLVKDTKFASQREWRGIWCVDRPERLPKYIVLQAPGILPYVRRVTISRTLPDTHSISFDGFAAFRFQATTFDFPWP